MINPVLMIVIPLVLAFLAVIFKKQGKTLLLIALITNIVMMFFLTKGQTIIGGFKAPFGISLVLDNYSYYSILLINSLFLFGSIISEDLIKKYSVVLLAALAGINGMLLTGDLFNLFVFLEITAIAAYILSSSSKKYKDTINYLILGSIGSIFYLLGIILLYSMTGSLNMADLAVKLGTLTDKQLYIPIILIFLGISVEAKMMPLSGWVKGIYQNANKLVGSLFASVFAGAILFVFGRLFVSVLPLTSTLKMLMLAIGLFTFVFGEFAAFKQVDVRKILLYSSIGQAGLVVTLFISGLTFPAVLLITSNVISKLVMFSISGMFKEQYDSDNYKKLGGVFTHNKIAGIAFTISALSITGIPLFFGFYTKLNIITGYFSQSNYIIPAIVLLVAIVEGAYIIRMLISFWAPGKEGQVSKVEFAIGDKKLMSTYKAIVALTLALVLLVAGLLPDRATKIITFGDAFLNGSVPSFSMTDLKGGN